MNNDYNLTIIGEEEVPMAAGITNHIGIIMGLVWVIMIGITITILFYWYRNKCKQYQERLYILIKKTSVTIGKEVRVNKWNLLKMKFQIENLELIAVNELQM